MQVTYQVDKKEAMVTLILKEVHGGQEEGILQYMEARVRLCNSVNSTSERIGFLKSLHIGYEDNSLKINFLNKEEGLDALIEVLRFFLHIDIKLSATDKVIQGTSICAVVDPEFFHGITGKVLDPNNGVQITADMLASSLDNLEVSSSSSYRPPYSPLAAAQKQRSSADEAETNQASTYRPYSPSL